jgi:regulator of replication initiation timing
MNTTETALISAVMMGISYTLGFLMKKKKIGAETEGLEIKNVEQAVAIWRGLATDLRDEVHMLNAQVRSLMEENKVLNIKIKDLERQVAQQ